MLGVADCYLAEEKLQLSFVVDFSALLPLIWSHLKVWAGRPAACFILQSRENGRIRCQLRTFNLCIRPLRSSASTPSSIPAFFFLHLHDVTVGPRGVRMSMHIPFFLSNLYSCRRLSSKLADTILSYDSVGAAPSASTFSICFCRSFTCSAIINHHYFCERRWQQQQQS
jgi:hypothetical protein